VVGELQSGDLQYLAVSVLSHPTGSTQPKRPAAGERFGRCVLFIERCADPAATFCSCSSRSDGPCTSSRTRATPRSLTRPSSARPSYPSFPWVSLSLDC
jgi:hypothetical protein